MSLAEVALAAAGRATRSGESTSLVMVHNSAQMRLGTYRNDPEVPADERSRAFVQRLAPPPHLLICGAAPDAEAVVSTARALGWRVSVVDHRPAYVIAARFAGAELHIASPNSLRAEIDLMRCHAAVVMSHHLPSDEVYLRELAEAGVPAYVGLLGPKARRSRLAQELGPLIGKTQRPNPRTGRPRYRRNDARGIALAIVGQIHAWLAGRGFSEAVLS